MKRPTLLIFSLALFLAACGSVQPTSLPPLPFVITLTPVEPLPLIPATSEPAAIASQVPSAQPSALPTASPLPSQAPSPVVPTATPTYIPFEATPTETLLPPLELPTEQPRAPAMLPWTGLPTYPGDSDPGLLFRLEYNPDIWAQTPGNFGEIVLAHRLIEYCTITPWSGRGLPVEWKATHDFRVIGKASFDVSIVTAEDVVKFVSYVGGDGHILTGFQVQFVDQKDRCIQAAESVLGTLHALAATPTPTVP